MFSKVTGVTSRASGGAPSPQRRFSSVRTRGAAAWEASTLTRARSLQHQSRKAQGSFRQYINCLFYLFPPSTPATGTPKAGKKQVTKPEVKTEEEVKTPVTTGRGRKRKTEGEAATPTDKKAKKEAEVREVIDRYSSRFTLAVNRCR